MMAALFMISKEEFKGTMLVVAADVAADIGCCARGKEED
jgi:hypothetical protein